MNRPPGPPGSDTSPVAEQAFTPAQVTCLLLLCMVGIILRFVAMNRSFWLDEVVTVLNTSMANVRAVLFETVHDNQPPLYNLTAFGWGRLFGYSEIAIRSLSLLFGLAALFTPWLARTALSRNAKIVNLLILCCMTFPIRYAQEARNYSLMFMLSCICLYSFYEANTATERGAAHDQPPSWMLFSGITLLAFSHIFGVMLALSFVGVLILRGPSTARRALLVLFGTLLAAAALGPLLMAGSGKLAGGNFWIRFGPKVVAVETLKLFTPIGVALLAYGLVRWRMARVPFERALGWTLLPFLLLLAGALVISLHTPIFTAHYLIGMVPAYALLVSWLLRPASGTGPRTVLVVGLLLAIQACALTFSPYLFVQEDLRKIAMTSEADDSRVCYVMPDGTRDLLPKVWGYYTKRFNRPDLDPVFLTESQIADEFAARRCGLWAEPHLSRRGASSLKNHQELAACHEVPLGRSGMAAASALVDCR